MAHEKENDKETKKDSVAGYSGTTAEGKKIKRPKDASKEAVISEAGATEPTQEFGGDGITPKAEWEKKYAEIKEKQAELDERNREKAVEASGVIQTAAKQKHEEAAKHHG